MDALWQTVIGGLAVAAITGLTIIAYRHPAAYGRIHRPLWCVLLGAWAVWFIYSVGFAVGSGNAVLATIKLNSSTVIKTPDQEWPSFWFCMTPAVVYGYLSFLSILPHILHEGAADPEGAKDDA